MTTIYLIYQQCAAEQQKSIPRLTAVVLIKSSRTNFWTSHLENIKKK